MGRAGTYKIIVLSLIVLVLNCCKKSQLDDCFSSAGDPAERLIPLENFTRLQIGQKFDVVLVQDTSEEPKLIVRAGENLLAGIETENVDGLLTIRNTNTCNFVRSFKKRIYLEVHVKDLSELIISGDVHVSNKDTLKLKSLRITESGLNDLILTVDVAERVFVYTLNSCGVILKGRAEKLEGSIEEVTNLDARDLVCDEVLINIHTPWDCYIDGREIIFVKIYNSGNIYYRQEPITQKELNVQKGTGGLLLLE